jgi:hypothetical protein
MLRWTGFRIFVLFSALLCTLVPGPAFSAQDYDKDGF